MWYLCDIPPKTSKGPPKHIEPMCIGVGSTKNCICHCINSLSIHAAVRTWFLFRGCHKQKGEVWGGFRQTWRGLVASSRSAWEINGQVGNINATSSSYLFQAKAMFFFPTIHTCPRCPESNKKPRWFSHTETSPLLIPTIPLTPI